MSFFKNKGIALLLAILLVLGSSLLSTRWKLGRESDKISVSFDYSMLGALHTLTVNADALAVIGQNNALDGAPVKDAAYGLDLALRYSADKKAHVYDCYQSLLRELGRLEQELSAASLSREDRESAELCMAALAQAQQDVEDSGYNDAVAAFLKKNGSAYTRALARLAGVSMPEYFA